MDSDCDLTRYSAMACACLLCGSALAQQVEVVLPEVRIPVPRLANSLAAAPSAVGRVIRIDLEDVRGASARMDEILVNAGAASWDAGNSLGIASGLAMRGFTLGNQATSQLQGARIYLNGHADIAWRFARDPATVSQVEVLQGHDATLLGAGSPGGALQYLSKTPTGTEFKRLQGSATSANGKRLVFDGEWHGGPLQTRSVFAIQRGEQTVERVEDARQAALVSTRWPWKSGDARLDLEYHGNLMPFPFGTAFAGDRFWLDHSYVDQRAKARRHYRRQALYVQQTLRDDLTASVYWQRAHSSRDETLVGFFDPLSATRLRGYYRLIDEKNGQGDSGLRLSGSNVFSILSHRWTLAWQRHREDRTFAGPQNIGGFNLDLADPVFPVDLTALALNPRFAFESYREQGLGAASVLQVDTWELRLGLRRSGVTIGSSTSPAIPKARVVDEAHTTASAGIGWRWSETQRVWLSHAESFQPNRGRLHDGTYLPPSRGLQWELGWQHRAQQRELTLQAFDLRQTNLPARDPNDRDAFVLVGSNRSRGVTMSADWVQPGYTVTGSATRQHVRIETPVAASQGPFLVGVPARLGALTVTIPSSLGRWSAQLQGAGSLPGDSQASFRAPGYGVWNLGWEQQASTGRFRWGLRVSNALDRRYVRALTGADNVWQGERRTLRAWLEAAL